MAYGAVVFFFALALLVLPRCSATMIYDDGESQSQPQQPQCADSMLARFPGWPKQLDASIYWFNGSDVPMKAGTRSNGHRHFDPLKPTVILFPGWTGHLGKKWVATKGHSSSVEECARISTVCSGEACPRGVTGNYFEPWFNAGWNVGIFYWDQFADEVCMRHAEQKIWFDRGGEGLRWKSYDPTTGVGDYQILREDGIDSITDFCVKSVTEALHGFAGKELRFVGFDIGAQLATRCAALLHFKRHEAHGLVQELMGSEQVAVPTRLTLLEPYFSEHHFHLTCREDNAIKFTSEQGLGDYTATATASTVAALYDKFKVVTEVYKSSVLTQQPIFGVVNEALTTLATLVVYDSGSSCGGVGFFNFKDHSGLAHVSCNHFAVVPLYFLSLGTKSLTLQPPPKPASPNSALDACPVPTAFCNASQIRQWIKRNREVGGTQVWKQVSGSETRDIQDDAFVLSPGIEEAAQAGNASANELVYVTPPQTAPEKAPQAQLWKILLGVVGVILLVAVLMFTGICKVGVSSAPIDAGGLDDEEEASEDEDGESHDATADPKLQGV